MKFHIENSKINYNSYYVDSIVQIFCSLALFDSLTFGFIFFLEIIIIFDLSALILFAGPDFDQIQRFDQTLPFDSNKIVRIGSRFRFDPFPDFFAGNRFRCGTRRSKLTIRPSKFFAIYPGRLWNDRN